MFDKSITSYKIHSIVRSGDGVLNLVLLEIYVWISCRGFYRVAFGIICVSFHVISHPYGPRIVLIFRSVGSHLIYVGLSCFGALISAHFFSYDHKGSSSAIPASSPTAKHTFMSLPATRCQLGSLCPLYDSADPSCRCDAWWGTS